VRKLLLSVLVVGAFTPAAAQALGNDSSDKSISRTPAATHSLAKLASNAQALAKKRTHRRKAKHTVAVPGALQSIAACESHDNPRAVGGGGAFRGKYQFDYGTWASVGGHGDPAAAPESEQDRRAAVLYAREGTTPWPVCGSQ
jgi:Transglycosylase-like domain